MIFFSPRMIVLTKESPLIYLLLGVVTVWAKNTKHFQTFPVIVLNKKHSISFPIDKCKGSTCLLFHLEKSLNSLFLGKFRPPSKHCMDKRNVGLKMIKSNSFTLTCSVCFFSNNSIGLETGSYCH